MEEKEKETIIANKYHYDTGYLYNDYSKDSIKLSKGIRDSTYKNNDKEWIFVPKSICDIFGPDSNGKVEIHIEKWFVDKEENIKFFNNSSFHSSFHSTLTVKERKARKKRNRSTNKSRRNNRKK